MSFYEHWIMSTERRRRDEYEAYNHRLTVMMRRARHRPDNQLPPALLRGVPMNRVHLHRPQPRAVPAPIRMSPPAVRVSPPPSGQSSPSEDDDCIICLTPKAGSRNLRCVRCHNSVHMICYQEWRKAKRGDSCVFCRGDPFTLL